MNYTDDSENKENCPPTALPDAMKMMIRHSVLKPQACCKRPSCELFSYGEREEEDEDEEDAEDEDEDEDEKEDKDEEEAEDAAEDDEDEDEEDEEKRGKEEKERKRTNRWKKGSVVWRMGLASMSVPPSPIIRNSL
ncbi:hypothetical protein GPALN_006583 [Globodera pallida]|nr:hypothetical protein GPALN_006583 [Globodera pallida]